MSTIQKVLVNYDEYLRLKEIETKFQEVSTELANVKKQLGKVIANCQLSIHFYY